METGSKKPKQKKPRKNTTRRKLNNSKKKREVLSYSCQYNLKIQILSKLCVHRITIL